MSNRSIKFSIGWQKYEDVMEKQLSCPILKNVMQNFVMQNVALDDEEIGEDDEDHDSLLNYHAANIPSIVPISEELIKEITILSNFDCWMGHTNFDITPIIKEELNNIPGIEVLKICSRYRFFVGIGSMFNFTDVRKDIETKIIPKGD